MGNSESEAVVLSELKGEEDFVGGTFSLSMDQPDFRGQISRRFLNEYFSKNGLQFSPDVELATTDMILPAVRYNMGIGFLPEEFAGDDLESGKVFEIDVNETLPERSIILIHDTEYPQSIASKAFQKFLAERKEQNR